MAEDAVFTLKLEPVLHDQFVAAAAATDRPPSQIVREFMRDFIEQQRAVREHDAWFRAEVEQAVREADDPNLVRVPHEDIASHWREKRAALLRQADQQSA
jgi:predicted transcriptional regulator